MLVYSYRNNIANSGKMLQVHKTTRVWNTTKFCTFTIVSDHIVAYTRVMAVHAAQMSWSAAILSCESSYTIDFK